MPYSSFRYHEWLRLKGLLPPCRDQDMVVEHAWGNEKRDRPVNNMNTVRNIRTYLQKKAAGLLLLATLLGLQLPGNAPAGSAIIAVQVDSKVKEFRLMIGTNAGLPALTVRFPVPFSTSTQWVTNTCTNFFAGTNYVSALAGGTNGLSSDPTSEIRVEIPAAPTGLQTVPLSLVVPVGVPIQISRDGLNWRDRILISEVPNPEQFAAAGLPPVSAPNGSLVLVTYRTVPDQPSLFFRPQPPALSPPIP